ncbi:DJ-1/PfpI family protein [Pseudovibrio denitrificans]|uniref:DJ-1/PfpI family protein n=1 Tax=Pseudovibrio denitrificans TaxID=258256 RepID=UPI0039BEE542
MTYHVAIAVFDGIDDLDLVGVSSVVGKAAEIAPDRLKLKFVSTVGSERHITAQGLEVRCIPHNLFPNMIVLPGGRAATTLILPSSFKRWLSDSLAKGAEVCTICSGAFLLGQCYNLSGQTISVHHAKRDIFEQRFNASATTGIRKAGPYLSVAGPMPGGVPKSVVAGLSILDRVADDLRRHIETRMEIGVQYS